MSDKKKVDNIIRRWEVPGYTHDVVEVSNGLFAWVKKSTSFVTDGQDGPKDIAEFENNNRIHDVIRNEPTQTYDLKDTSFVTKDEEDPEEEEQLPQNDMGGGEVYPDFNNNMMGEPPNNNPIYDDMMIDVRGDGMIPSDYEQSDTSQDFNYGRDYE